MRKWIAVVVSLVGLMSCGDAELPVADVSNIQVDVPVVRMEQAVSFVSGVDSLLRHQNDEWMQEYGEPYKVLVQVFLRVGSPEDPMIGQHINLAAKSGELELFQNVNTDLQTIYTNFSAYENQLMEALKHYHYYFPDSSLPSQIVTLNSYFNAQSFITSKNEWCIGLDMFLGKNSAHLELLPRDIFPDFLKEKMEMKYLVPSAVQAWLLEKCYFDTGEEFLDKIVSAGKIMYLLDVVLPNVSREDKIQFTKEEWAWCEANKANVWRELVEKKTLFSKDPAVIDNWIKDGPFTKGLPQESPSRMGRWIGWQMVKDYMKKNPETTIPQLMGESNPKRILKHFKPEE